MKILRLGHSFISIILVISLFTVFIPVSMQVEAASLGTNLINNPGGETVSANYGELISNGWSGSNRGYSYATSDSINFLGITSHSGNYLMSFYNPGNSNGVITCYQDIDVSSQSEAIDSGTIIFNLTGYLCATGGNTAIINLEEFNASDGIISTTTYSKTVSSGTWTQVSLSDAVAYSARKLRVSITGNLISKGCAAFDDMDMKIGLNNDNPPVISQIPNQSVLSGAVLGPLSLNVTDPDQSFSSLTASAVSSNTTLIPNNNITLNFASATSTVTLSSVLGKTGNADITITVSDGIKSTIMTFTVTVYPEISLDTNLVINGTGESITGWTDPESRFLYGASNNNVFQMNSSNNYFMYQDINMGKYAPLINAGFLTYTATCTVENGGQMNLQGLDKDGASIWSAGTGSLCTIPNSTRTIRINVGGNSGCKIDNVTFQINSNGLPRITSISNQTVQSGSNTGDLSFTVGYVGSSAVLSAASSDTSIVQTADVIFGGSGYERTVNVMPQSGVSGTATITIKINGIALTSFNVEAYVPVADITNVQTTTTVGTQFPLSGTVVPSNATHKLIIWSLKDAGTTGVSLKNGVLTATGVGTATITSTIVNGLGTGSDYVKDFVITVNPAKLATPAGLAWDGVIPGKATWSAVPNRSSYTVQLYKNGKQFGSSVTGIMNTDYDFTSAIEAEGSGAYTFTVTTIGNGAIYLNSDISDVSSAYNYSASGYLTVNIQANGIKNNNVYTVSARIKNLSDKPIYAMGVIAFYSGDRLISMNISNISGMNGLEDTNISAEITTQITEVTAKVFVWDSQHTLQPFSYPFDVTF